MMLVYQAHAHTLAQALVGPCVAMPLSLNMYHVSVFVIRYFHVLHVNVSHTLIINFVETKDLMH